MKLTWSCPEPNCDDVVIVANFDGYTMSTFRNIILLHAESTHELDKISDITRWMSRGLTWVQCTCGVPYWSEFENVVISIHNHVKLIYHNPCPYCHQGGLPAPAVFRMLSTVPTCPCGRFLPEGFRVDAGKQ